MSREAVGARLAALCKERKVTGTDLAELMDWRKARVSMVLNGKAPLSFDAVPDLAESLGMPPEHLAWALAGGDAEVARPNLGSYGRQSIADAISSVEETLETLRHLDEVIP